MKSKRRLKLKRVTMILITMILVLATSAFASNVRLDRKTAKLGDAQVVAHSEIHLTGATSGTEILGDYQGSVEVSIEYICIHKDTGEKVTLRNVYGNSKKIELAANRPSSSYRSWRVRGTHTARYSGHTWTTNTEAFY